MGKITFYKLWDKLNRSGLKQKDLISNKIVSSGTLDKLRHNACVNTETLAKLCDYLKCELDDICEYEPAKEEKIES